MNKYLATFLGVIALFLGGCQVVTGERTVNEYSSDAAITANVKAALLNNKYVTSLPIRVETQDRMVVLSGFVKTNKQKLAAGQTAERVKEVREVRNNIIVR